MAHCENSLAVFGVDVYPTTLPDAFRFASKFKPLTTTKAPIAETIAPPVQTSTVLFAAAVAWSAGAKVSKGCDRSVVT